MERYRRLADYDASDFFYDDWSVKPLDEIPKDKLYAIMGVKAGKSKVTTTKTSTKGGVSTVTNKIQQAFINDLKLPNKKDVLDSIALFLGLGKNMGGEGQGGNVFNFNNPVQFNIELAPDEEG